MSLRTWILAGLVLVGLGLVTVVRPPAPRTGQDAVRGQRVFRVARASAVRAIDVTVGPRRLQARADAGGWTIDGRPVEARVASALDDLRAHLAGLRAVDVFRPRDAASYGLDRPQATVTLHVGHRLRTLVVGDINAAGSALYARREGDPRVMLVGVLLLSQLERVFYRPGG